MIEPKENPYLPSAHQRFQDLLKEAERVQAPAFSDKDPYESFYRAEEWGVPSWVHCMVQVDATLAQLRELAVADAAHPSARGLFLDMAVGALNALVLYEQGTKTLDKETLAWLVDRYHDEIEEIILAGEEELKEGGGVPLDQVLGPDEGFWSTPNVAARAEAFLQEDAVEEVPVDEAGHDFPPPADLDGAERGLARNLVALRQSAAGSSATKLGGIHASPANTDPSMIEEGKH